MRFWVNVFVVGFLVVCVVCSVHSAFAVTHQEASDQVAEADKVLRSAFKSVLDAEQSGANVSALLSRLNDAGSNLIAAEEVLAAGNYSGAVDLAGTVKLLANGVGSDADVLRSYAVAAAGNWWVTVVFSVVSSVVFGVALLFIWRWFRRRRVNKMLGSRPEVTG